MSLASFLENIFSDRDPNKQPEDYYQVTITDELIKVEHPKHKQELIKWKEIQTITIITTDTGPAAPDIWLALYNANDRCIIPQGAKGFDEIYDIVSKYKDFNFENVTNAMRCTDNAEFELWSK